MNNFYFRNK
jgi:hypothetical protein